MDTVLRDWITNLTVAALIGAVVDILLPNSDFKKYTRFIIGLILLVILLQPLMLLTGRMGSLDKAVEAGLSRLDMSISSYEAGNMVVIQNKQIKSVYKKNLEKQIEKHLSDRFELSHVEAEVVLSNEDYASNIYNYKIERIDLVIQDKKITINPVVIDIDKSKNGEKGTGELDSKLAEDIRDELKELLEISSEVVHIYTKD